MPDHRGFFWAEDPTGKACAFALAPDDDHLKNHDTVWFTWDKENRKLDRLT